MKLAVLTPTSRPKESSRGPPLLPALMLASVCWHNRPEQHQNNTSTVPTQHQHSTSKSQSVLSMCVGDGGQPNLG